MKSQTLKQIMKDWRKLPDYILNSFCCPDCKTTLINYSGTLICPNSKCLNNDQYTPFGERME